MPLFLGGLYAGNAVMQERFGTADDFLELSFETEKDPDALADFYQAEDLLRIIAIHPFFFSLFMDKVIPDTEEATSETALLSLGETHFTTKYMGLEVSFEIIEQEEEDDNGDDVLTSFRRHERFIDWMPLLYDLGVKILLWDQTLNFGFERQEDGKYKVFHQCEEFIGPWPVRVCIEVYQRYLIWACQKYINGKNFGTEDIDAQLEEMAFLPGHVAKDFFLKLKGQKEKQVESSKNDPSCSQEDLKKQQEELDKLTALAEQDAPKIAVAKRPVNAPGGQGAETVKLVVKDKDTQAAIESAYKDAKGNHAVNDAMRDLTKDQDLEWKPRETGTLRRSRRIKKKLEDDED